ncbi:hypothetical protein [Branchiibius cervicis]|uniref:Uncharacterized protein n=1 Tax=Branchiibius cervicis TaxID=908252 RepID=A0ABW2AVA0_9MICO
MKFSTWLVLDSLLAAETDDVALSDREFSEADQADAHRALTERGWIVKDSRLSGGWTFGLTPEGRSAGAQKVKVGLRRRQVQQALLDAVTSGTVNGAQLTETTSTAIEGPGGPFTEEELGRATKTLHDAGLINGFPHSGPGLLRPEVTDLGLACIESGYAPADFIELRSNGNAVSPGNTYNNQFTGNVAAVQQGDHNTANVSIGAGEDHLAQVLALLQTIREHAADRAADDPHETEIIVAQADVVEADARSGLWDRVKQTLPVLARLTAYGLGKEVGKEITEATDAVLGLINP